MLIDIKTRDQILQDHINRETAKTTVFLRGIIEKHEYLTGEKILASNQSINKKQVKFTYFLIEKNF